MKLRLLVSLLFVISLSSAQLQAQVPEGAKNQIYRVKADGSIVYRDAEAPSLSLKSADIDLSKPAIPSFSLKSTDIEVSKPSLPSVCNSDVLIITLVDVASANDMKSRLLSTGQFNSIEVWNLEDGDPSIETLRQYDVVFIFYYWYWSDPSRYDVLEANLVQYINEGGGVVTAAEKNNFSFQDGFLMPVAYEVFSTGFNFWGSRSLGAVLIPDHPIMSGVASLIGGYRSASYVYPLPGAEVIAKWDDNTPLVGVRRNIGLNKARRVHLNLYPGLLNEVGWDTTTDGLVLITNSLHWAAQICDCPSNISKVCIDVVNYDSPRGYVQTAGLPSGALFPLGTTVNSFLKTINDVPVTCTFTVKVADSESPEIDVCGNTFDVPLKAAVVRSRFGITIQYTGSLPEQAILASITDNCDLTGTSISKVNFTNRDLGMNKILVTATDEGGNTTECTIYANVYLPTTRFKNGNVDVTEIINESDMSQELMVYPNPTNGKVNLFLTNLNNPEVAVKLFNSTGTQVFGQNITTDGPVELDLAGKVSGIYLLKVTADGKEFNERIVLK